MGGCASRPKDLDRLGEAARPIEEPAKAEDKKDQSPDEAAPLVDLSEPEEGEAEDTETTDEAVLVIPGDAKIVVENPKGETIEVEVTAKEGEIIYVEAVMENRTEEEAKEEEKKEEAVKEEEEKVEQTIETAPAAATSEDKKE